MSDTVIRVENLGKKYIIGHQQQERYTALRDVITDKVKSLGSLINPQAKNENPAFEEFWALKDVSFEIKQGDRVGIIGRNGAGKSTLLKILSRITEPTTGSIKIKGRVASLLEVGTGFHPELTGRENIFLNGAILGMGNEQIKRKFDEIVAFAEVEKFLDTPVKRYSSGMYVRLAFAVAAHLEPEILIVDEVLAVGDAQFQKKCLGKMEDVGKEGRTVFFVSHNMGAVRRLCSRAIWLEKGQVKASGNSSKLCDDYLAHGSLSNSGVITFEDGKNMDLHFLKVEMLNSSQELTNFFRSNEAICLKIYYRLMKDLSGTTIVVNICSISEDSLWSVADWDIYPELFEFRSKGAWMGEWIIPESVLAPGRYLIALGAGDGSTYYHHPQMFGLEISKEGTWRPSWIYFGDRVKGLIAAKMQVKEPLLLEDNK
ncbi:ABC transporter ATP-binding protein [Dolichospermum sp. LEGE 00246]|uniref:ABC transporter ATP-binding protein n=1 Tax=Dolichospermum sp. LEGE 00246 TaxID=1828605 RepID=UPI00187F9142|nr:ABC transporter ATP-binding protein [Dolichospermum sp. LEGE 00246]MBE9258870.1 ABC transporter ATP-binding protein [Dolichospermum sp. LEGE 00246]